MRSRRTPWVVVAVAMLLGFLFVATPAATAMEHGPGGEQQPSNPDNEAESSASSTHTTTSQEISQKDHETHSPIAEDPPCAEWEWITITVPAIGDGGGEADTPPDWEPPLGGDPDVLWPPSDDGGGSPETTITVRGDCLVFWDCAGERIDEIFTGELSDESPKSYAEYVGVLGSIVQGFVPFTDWNIGDPETFRSLAEALANGGLGPRPSPLEMPIFYFCRYGEGGPIELFEPGFTPTFGWDTDVDTEFDIVETRTVLVAEARALIEGHEPGLTAIPPLDQGYSIVKFPMWLWLDNPLAAQTIHSYSDPATIRVSLAAVFNRIEWNMAGDIVDCTLDDMREYTGGDPTDNPPDCTHTFDELVDYRLTAQVFYDVYERISYRGSELIPWPENLWAVHPSDPILVVNIDEGDMSVHELLSLNVVSELDAG